jgi:hypothetical protein
MRLSKLAALLAAALPLVLASPIVPPGFSCFVGAHRCDSNSLQVCPVEGIWATITECTSTEFCFTHDYFPNGGGCLPNPYKAPVSSNPVSSAPVSTPNREHCDQPNTSRCAFSPPRIQTCAVGSWRDVQICDPGSTCWADDDLLPGPRRAACARLPETKPAKQPESNDDCTTPGFQTCDPNLYTLLTCSAERKWKTASKCLTPGDCKIDGTAQAHCEHGGMDPPRRRDVDACNPGDQACDSERRFFFLCDAQGSWYTEQCFAPGYCRGEWEDELTCAGFPMYGGDDGECNAHCESMDYLYCIGVSLCFLSVSDMISMMNRATSKIRSRWRIVARACARRKM